MEDPPGSYRAEWVNPASGTVIETKDYKSSGAELILVTPKYLTDIALRMRNI